MLETLETAQYFDRHAARYDELIGTVSFQVDDAYNYLARYVAGAWADKNPLRILELGIGTGLLTGHLLRTHSAAVVARESLWPAALPQSVSPPSSRSIAQESQGPHPQYCSTGERRLLVRFSFSVGR